MYSKIQFLYYEGLGDVVQSPEFQAEVARVGRGPGGHDDDGDGGGRRIAAQNFADAEAVEVGEHHVQYHEVRGGGRRGVENGGHFMVGETGEDRGDHDADGNAGGRQLADGPEAGGGAGGAGFELAGEVGVEGRDQAVEKAKSLGLI